MGRVGNCGRTVATDITVTITVVVSGTVFDS
jgi:hypothetical protein